MTVTSTGRVAVVCRAVAGVGGDRLVFRGVLVATGLMLRAASGVVFYNVDPEAKK